MLIDWFTVGAQVVNFLILVVLLKKFLYGPITQAMAAREAKIQAQITEAETRRQEAAATEAEVQKRLQELEDKRQILAAQVEAEVAEQKKALQEAARQEVGKYRQGWLQALSREKTAFAQTLQERCSHQAFTLARLILRELGDLSLEERFLQVFFDKLRQLPPEDEQAFRESLTESGGAAVVASAFQLDEANRARLLTAVQAQFGPQVTVQFETDPSLIMGLELKTSSRKLSWTAERSLHNLEEQVMAAINYRSPRRLPMPAEPPVLETLVAAAESALNTVLDHFQAHLQAEGIGVVHFVGNGIALVSGLPGIKSEELVRFPDNLLGLAFNVDAHEVGVILLGETGDLKAGAEVRRTGRVLDVPVGEALLGRVVDSLGRPLDDLGPVQTVARLPVERDAPPIMHRAPVTVPLQTGLKVVDALIPIGRGQRELILGDRQTGKTTIALDTLLNQRDPGCYLHLLQHRPAGFGGGPAHCRSAPTRRLELLHRGGGPRRSPAGACILWPPSPPPAWPNISWNRAGMSSSSMTT